MNPEFEAWLMSPDGGSCAEVKDIGNDLYAAAKPLMFHWTIIVGQIGDRCGYEDNWCYQNREMALIFLRKWDGQGEPIGWHRNQRTGRRRPGGDPAKEYHVD